MKRRIITFGSIITVLLVGSIIYFVFFFELFPAKRINKGILKMSGRKIYVDYIPGNATSEGNIQVRVVFSDSKESTLKNIGGFNSLKTMKAINDSTIEITIADTIYSFAKLTDTIVVPKLFND